MNLLQPTRNVSRFTKWLLLLFGILLLGLSVTAAPVPHPQPRAKAAPTVTKKKRKSKKVHAVSRRHHGPIQTEPDAERTTEIQSALSRGGYYQGDPSGKWDGDTVGAVQKFQSANGLDATGKLDAPTLQKLGLGSEIAGVSAPHAPPNAPRSELVSRTPAANSASSTPASSPLPAASAPVNSSTASSLGTSNP